MDNYFYLTLHNVRNYLSMLVLNDVNKRGPCGAQPPQKALIGGQLIPAFIKDYNGLRAVVRCSLNWKWPEKRDINQHSAVVDSLPFQENTVD